jgi:hypothetical protein
LVNDRVGSNVEAQHAPDKRRVEAKRERIRFGGEHDPGICQILYVELNERHLGRLNTRLSFFHRRGAVAYVSGRRRSIAIYTAPETIVKLQ